MSWILALDENVLYYAAKLENPAGTRDETCFRLILEMERGGHFMCATPELWALLAKVIDLLKITRTPVIPQISKIIGNLLHSRFLFVQTDVMTDGDAKLVRDKHGEGDLAVTKSAAGADPEIGSKGLISTDQKPRFR